MELVQLGRKAREEAEKENNCPGDAPTPFSPPDAFAPPGEDLSVPDEDLHPVLLAFRKEHRAFAAQIEAAERTLGEIQAQGPNREADEAMGQFFQCLETEVLPHNRREEEVLFPLISQRLKESGEHSKSDEEITGVDILVADHLHIVQLSAVMLNFFGVAGHLPDRASAKIVIEAGLAQGRALIELLRLHMFREDEVLFALAHKLLTTEELDRMQEELA